MTTFPLLTCGEMLGIDPKTLRKWLRQAQMPLHSHPSDARMKCLTMEQIQRLATLHGRALTLPEVLIPQLGEPIPPKEAEPMALWEAGGASAQLQKEPEPIPLPDETAWLKQMAYLEAQVASLQAQLMHLQSLAGPLMPSFPLQQVVERQDAQAGRQEKRMASLPDVGLSGAWPAHPAESRRRPVLPLIQYGAAGTYVIICPQQGELLLMPDSPEWFAWLASLSSFRFVGKHGRLSASRNYDHGPKRTWYAYRVIHQRTHKQYLGTTDHLTIACLEQVAAKLQSYTE